VTPPFDSEDGIEMIAMVDKFRIGKLNLVYHTSRSFKRGRLGGARRIFARRVAFLWALGRLVGTGKGRMRVEERDRKRSENDSREGSSTWTKHV